MEPSRFSPPLYAEDLVTASAEAENTVVTTDGTMLLKEYVVTCDKDGLVSDNISVKYRAQGFESQRTEKSPVNMDIPTLNGNTSVQVIRTLPQSAAQTPSSIEDEELAAQKVSKSQFVAQNWPQALCPRSKEAFPKFSRFVDRPRRMFHDHNFSRHLGSHGRVRRGDPEDFESPFAPKSVGFSLRNFRCLKTLWDFLIMAPALTREELSPVISYFNLVLKSLQSQKRKHNWLLRDRVDAPHDSAGSFSIFPMLPNEIQCIVWECALPGSRIFELTYGLGVSPNFQLISIHRQVAYVVFACKTSQHTAMKYYQKMAICCVGGIGASSESVLLVNYQIDVFYFCGPDLPEVLKWKVRGSSDDFVNKQPDPAIIQPWRFIQKIAINMSPVGDSNLSKEYFFRVPPPQSLREIIFVGQPGDEVDEEIRWSKIWTASDPGALIKINLEDQPNHYLFEHHASNMRNIQTGLALEPVAELYSQIKISFAILERSTDERPAVWFSGRNLGCQ